MAAAAMTHGGGVRDRAVAWSLLGHGLLVLLVMIGGIIVPRSPPPTQLAIKATLVDPAARRTARATPEPVPKPVPEPVPEPEPERQPEVQQAAKERQVEQQKRELAQQRERDLQEKQETEKATAQLAEKQRQDKLAADRAKAAAKAEDEAKAKAEAARVKAARLKEEAARREAAEAAVKRDIARQLAEEEELLAAADSGALAAYVALIRQKVERNWVRPPGARPGIECEVLVTQIPGGQVTGVRMGTCNADDAVRRSIEAAVLRASPLPLPDEAALFERNLRFTFKPQQ